MDELDYLMESEYEAFRLDLKTDAVVVEEQARWAGVSPGMRVLDLGCGVGKTTHLLHELVGPHGVTVGVDGSARRIAYASRSFSRAGIRYVQRDARGSLSDLGPFDLVWVRFLLEYFAGESFAVAKNAHDTLAGGGTLCLIDLDHNCLGHFGAPPRLDKALRNIVFAMQRRHGFDPFVGRKLYAHLFDLGCTDIEVRMTAHHLIYGQISATDRFNWLAKAEAARRLPACFDDDYPGGYQEFHQELVDYLDDPRRFIYTPIILCKGRRAGEPAKLTRT